MVAARLNLESTEPSIFANGWTIFFGIYLVTTSAESVFPSASLKMNRDFADSTSWPWAAVAKSKPHAQIAMKQGARGVIFGIKSATYQADRLPSQPVFYVFRSFFRRYWPVLRLRPERTGFWTGMAGRVAGGHHSSSVHYTLRERRAAR